MGEGALAILFYAVALLILAGLIAEAFGHGGLAVDDDGDVTDA